MSKNKIYGKIGVLKQNSEGMIQCHICGDYFNRPMAHSRMKHNILSKEYKKTYGLDTTKGICSPQSKEKSRLRIMENYDNCVTKNLIVLGEKTRYPVGFGGRTKDKVSKQTHIRLVKHIRNVSPK